MARTRRRVLIAGSIAFLLALTALAGGAAPAAADSRMTATRLLDLALAVRPAIELVVLAVACSIVVAFFSVTAGERGGTRVPARVRQR